MNSREADLVQTDLLYRQGLYFTVAWRAGRI